MKFNPALQNNPDNLDNGQNKILSISEASSILKISPSSLRRLEKEGKIASYRLPNNYRVFRLREITALKERLQEVKFISTLESFNNQAKPFKPSATRFEPQTKVPFLNTLRNPAVITSLLLLSGISYFLLLSQPKKDLLSFVPDFAPQDSADEIDKQRTRKSIKNVLALEESNWDNTTFFINIDTNIKKLEVAESLKVNGPSVFNGDVSIPNQSLNLGTGSITASNILYGVKAGDGIEVTSGQTPTISNDGVLSLQGKTGELKLKEGDGISISGLEISSDIDLDDIDLAEVASNGGCTDCLNFSDFSDSATLDANTNIATAGFDLTTSGTGDVSFNNTGSFGVAGAATFSSTLSTTGSIDTQGTLQAGTSNITLTLASGLIDADSITLTTSGGAGSTLSNSGLEVISDGLTLLKGCSNDQILKWNNTSLYWYCADDSGGGGAIN